MTAHRRGAAALLIVALVTIPSLGSAAIDPPFPEPDAALTVGDFFRVLARPDALDINVAVRDSVPRAKPLTVPLRGMSCREALELVVAVEDLRLTELRPGLYVVSGAGDRAPVGKLTQRRFRLTYATPAQVIAFVRANRALAARIDVDRLSAVDAHTLLAVDTESGLSALSDALGEADAPSVRHPAVIPVSFLDRPAMEAALRALPPDALGGLRPEEIAYLPARRSVLVNGTPDQVERLRAVLAQIDVAPESVTLGVTRASRTADRSRETGVDTGRVAYGVSRTAASDPATLWVTTLSGSPARIALEQIFVIPLTQTLATTQGAGTGGGIAVSRTPLEVPTGLSLEVLPRALGRAVQVDVSLVDSSPTSVTDVGVNRSQRALVTRALVPRGASITIGGLAGALSDTGTSGALALLHSQHDTAQNLTVVLTVK